MRPILSIRASIPNRIKAFQFLTLLAALITASCLSITTCDAQLFGEAKQDELKLDSALVPNSAFGAITIHPQEILKNPLLAAFPREIVTAAGLRELGFDPMLIEQATLFGGELDTSDSPRWALVLRFTKLQALAGNLIDDLKETTIGGKKAFIDDSFPQAISYLVYDESTIVIGESRYFESILTEGKGSIAKLMENKNVNGQALGFVDIEKLRPFFQEVISEMPKLAPPIEDLKKLPRLIKSISFGTDTSNRLTTKIEIQANNQADAEEASEIITQSLKHFHAFLITQMSQELDMTDPVQAATVQYVDRIWNKYEPNWIPEVNGAKMTMTVHEEILALPSLAAVGAVGAEEVLNPRTSPQNRSREVVLGILNYESAYQKFPPHTIRDEDGKPLYSGRVAFLPFIEQNNLYQNLKKDEPWNSRHNAEFTNMMVPAFSDPDGEGIVRFPVFPGGIWDGDEGTRFRDMIDGSSNTILLILSPVEPGTSWADPTPWKISPTDPMRDIFGNRERVMVTMADGSTRYLEKSKMTNEKLKAMLTKAGGELLN